MSAPDPRAVVEAGLWSQNPALVQLLGLCPLLAVSTNAVNALGLGLATVLALTVTNTTIALLKPWIRPEIRIPAYVLVIAAAVSAVDLAMQAWLPALHGVLGLFIPLIVTNCAVLARAEAFAARAPVGRAALDGLAMGAGFLAVLLAIGALRELLGHGTLFAGAGALLGDWARGVELTVVPGYRGLLLAVLPPGAFIVLALLIAARNAWRAHRASAASTPTATDSR